MKKLLIGRSPLTTIAGYLVAILMSVHQVAATGSHGWPDIVLPAAIALLGRMAGDDKQPPLPPLPTPAPTESPDLPVQPVTFKRRGREHQQRRSGNGRFATATA